MGSCRLCDDPATENGLCHEHAIAAEMSPEITGIVMCGSCGLEAPAESEGWVVRASFREGGDPWSRCPSCIEAWKLERRREEAFAKGEQARALPESEWRWLRTRWSAICLLCGEMIDEGEKVRHAPSFGIAHPGCTRKLGVQQAKARGTLTLAAS
jgi:hypothetical protein